jgi:putative FmdB family regulatory protein
MPTYQYACTNDDCGLRFERVQAFTDDAITSCPDCADRVRKVYGSVGVVFKGSGFYRNDSRQTAAAASGSGNSSTESSTSDNGAAKPASADKPAAASGKSDSTGTSPAPSKSGSSETKSSAPIAS